MDRTSTHERTDLMDMREGDRFACSNCGCEIALERHGDPERMQNMRAFTCCCGTRMERREGSAT